MPLDGQRDIVAALCIKGFDGFRELQPAIKPFVHSDVS